MQATFQMRRGDHQTTSNLPSPSHHKTTTNKHKYCLTTFNEKSTITIFGILGPLWVICGCLGGLLGFPRGLKRLPRGLKRLQEGPKRL